MSTCISLFSGGGGLDLGLEAAGFETIVATDIDFHSCESLRVNKSTSEKLRYPFLGSARILCEDITKLSGRMLLEMSGLNKGELDLLAGGPPCQAFSVFGKRKGRADPRGQLVFHYLRMLKELQPKAFVFENVYGLLTIEGGSVFEELKHKLSAPSRGARYKLSVHRVDAVNFGVPQFRDRIFVIGSRDGIEVKEIEPLCDEKQTLFDTLLPRRTVSDALRALPKIGHSGSHNHIGREHSSRIIERYRSMPVGARDSCTRINKLDPNRPSFTIIVGSDKGGGKGHIHPHEPREVTPRESARIQCFPDWWWFSGTSRHPIRQVGNAVPPLLGFAIGRQVMSDIFKKKKMSWLEGIRSLDLCHMFTPQELKSLAAASHSGQLIDRRRARRVSSLDLPSNTQ